MTRSPLRYEFGPFRLVPEERLLLRDSDVVHLTPKVFDTLVALVQNGGRLLSKRELLGLVWQDTVVEENNLTQAISAIRKALGGTDHSGDYIQTVPKLGYRFVAAVQTDDDEMAVDEFKRRQMMPGWKVVASGVLALFVLAALVVWPKQGGWRSQQRAAARSVDQRPAASASAYKNYLNGLGALDQRTDPSLRAAIFYFERAIELDSSYALAYAALADSYVLLGLYDMSSQEVLPRAHLAATKAVQLDSTSAEAHTALAAIDAFYDWNWAAARQEFERALQLRPDYPLAHHWYGVAYWVPMGRYDQALAQLTQARKLAPQSLIIQTDLGWVCYVMREYERAIAEYDSVIKRDANFLPAHYVLSLAYERVGQYAQAVSELRTSRVLNRSWVRSATGRVESLTGYRNALRSILSPAPAPAAGQPGLYAGALAYMRLGRRADALLWLQFAYQQRDPGLVYVAADPVFDSVRNDPSFRDLIRRVGVVH